MTFIDNFQYFTLNFQSNQRDRCYLQMVSKVDFFGIISFAVILNEEYDYLILFNLVFQDTNSLNQ
jgi:hypothetical protein